MASPFRRPTPRLLLPVLAVFGVSCVDASPLEVVEPPPTSRGYRLGFSAAPPRFEPDLAHQTFNAWSARADIALIPVFVPWEALLRGAAPPDLVLRDYSPIVRVYRERGLPLVVLVESIDPVLRDREAPELLRIGRSITEAKVQDRYRDFVVSLDSILEPEYIGLASEVNLTRAVGSPELYQALTKLVSMTARALRERSSGARLLVSAQVETAWGLIPRTGRFEGIGQILHDFPSIDALGLSTYPYLGGFDRPEDVPLDYFLRLMPHGRLPLLVVEGGWPSRPVLDVASSEEMQARWILREMEIAAHADVVAVMQIPFTDLDPLAYGGAEAPYSYFTHLGLVDTDFRPKAALTEWDRIFGREFDAGLPAAQVPTG